MIRRICPGASLVCTYRSETLVFLKVISNSFYTLSLVTLPYYFLWRIIFLRFVDRAS